MLLLLLVFLLLLLLFLFEGKRKLLRKSLFWGSSGRSEAGACGADVVGEGGDARVECGEVCVEACAAALEAVDARLDAADRLQAAPARVTLLALAPHGTGLGRRGGVCWWWWTGLGRGMLSVQTVPCAKGGAREMSEGKRMVVE